MFKDRIEAGTILAAALKAYKDKDDTIVIALPRGGVVVAYYVAQALNLPMDIIVARKIGMPNNPEAAIGAITVDGQEELDRGFIKQVGITQDYIDLEIAKERKEAERRMTLYRGDRPALDLQNKTVLLVDDGVATGSTIRVAIKSAYVQGAKKVVIAVPVAPAEFVRDTREDIICIKMPDDFIAVGGAYRNFEQVENDEVIRYMSATRKP